MRQIDHLNQWAINVWGGIIGHYVIGPYFFDERLTGAVYLKFLQHHLPILLQNVDLETRQGLWFQHDGAPPHFHRDVQNYLNEWMENRWMGRGGPIAWPARSPDMTLLDYFLWDM